ncbi:SAM-dependent methyltransferase [Arcobacter sp. LA11]|uniref:SAM-dependent methyltransferase n=1 Tax=Arcobacter sp. LA11 TaxID=1898176 RepID=UPI00093418A5|nr:SAM-dependent methyltransferase [Arcobacter sp. LA11]
MNTEKLKFSDYFNKWLYSKDGYYSNYKQIGKEGDFYTSVSTSSFFGGSIGKRIVDSIKEGNLPKNTTILEVGAHHGYLLADIIQFIYTLNPKLLESLNFAIVERFDNLQKQQTKYLQECFGDVIKIKHYNDISEVKLPHAFIVANEIFDAFSCELVYTNKEENLQMAYVKNHKIEFENCKDVKIIDHCKKYKITKGEVGIGYEEFIENITSNIKKFEFVTFDYGDKVPRNDFSSRIYEKHEVFPIFKENLDLEKYFAKTDITYDVYFTHIEDCFKDFGVKNVIFKTQMQALVEFGIIDLLEILKENSDENTYLRESQKIKTLVEPTGMGDRFKMLHVKKFS